MCRAFEEMIKDGEKRGERRGERKGAQRVNELNRRLAADKRVDDIMRSASSQKYQSQLLKEYGL